MTAAVSVPLFAPPVAAPVAMPQATADVEPVSPTVLWLPSLRGTITHAATFLVLGTIVPLSLFYGLFTFAGLDVALLGVLAWSGALIAQRVRGARRVEATLVLSTALMLVRVGVAWGTGSAFVYLLQPLLSTFVTAAALLGSVVIRRPFTERVARDYVPLPAEFLRQPNLHTCFIRISLIWGVGYVISGTAALWMLMTMSMGQFMVLSKTLGLAMTGLAIAASIVLFLRTLRRHKISLRFGTPS